jgi:hypothetical protein
LSFDIFLMHFENGDPHGTPRAPVLDVLNRRSYSGPDQFGFYIVDIPGAGTVEFSAKGLEGDKEFHGCAFHVRQFGPELAKFIFDVASTGAMVVMPMMEGSPLIFVDESMRKHVPHSMLESFTPVKVSSAEELESLLFGGFGGWSEYRDKVQRRV